MPLPAPPSLLRRLAPAVALGLALAVLPSCAEKPKLTLGLITPRNPELAAKSYQPIAEYLGNATGTTLVLDPVVNYDDGVARMKAQKWDVAFTTSRTYMEAKPFGYQLLAMVSQKGQSSYKALIVSRRDGDITRVSDLRGRHLALVSKKSASGYLYPMKMLLDAGLDPANDVKLTFTGNAGTIGHAVARPGDNAAMDFDAGAIYEGFLNDNPEVAKQLRVLAASDPIPHGPVVAGPKLVANAGLLNKLRAALLEAGTRSPATFAGSDLYFDGFAPPVPAIFDGVAAVEARVAAYEKKHPIAEGKK